MRAVFFDDIVHHGGAPRSTLELMGRLPAPVTPTAVLAHGGADWFEALARDLGVECRVLLPHRRPLIIGRRGGMVGRSWRRAHALWRVRSVRQRLILPSLSLRAACTVFGDQ